MPCNDCSRAEDCPPCVNEPTDRPQGCIAHGGPDCICEPTGSTSSSPDGCVEASHCFEHAERCCHCGRPKDSAPHVHEWSEFQQGSTLYPRALQVEYAHCDCGASKARRAEDEKCGHVRLGVTEDSCFRPKGHPGMHESKLRVWTDLADEKPQEPEAERWKTARCRDCEEPIPEGVDRCNDCAWMARNAQSEKCYCGCVPEVHMGKPTGCTKHGFHEFIRASFVSGADPDAPACVTCEHAQGAHPKGGHCVGWTADGAKCGCDGYGPLGLVCTHCQGPHALEDCKGLEEPEEAAYDAHDFISQEHCKDCGDAWDRQLQGIELIPRPEAKDPSLAPRRPPYAVAYAVEGGALYEVAVPGDATVVAEDGCLQVLHPKKPVLAIVRITPMNMEENDG